MTVKGQKTTRPGTRNKIAVIGAGSWGTTFAKVLCDAGNSVTVWARRPELANELEAGKRNSQYLPGINLPKNLHATSQLKQAIQGANQVYLAVPSQTVRATLQLLETHLTEETLLVSLVKGLEKKTTMRISQVIADVLALPAARVGVVSGPNIALEIAKRQPTGAVASCEDLGAAQQIASACQTKYFRCYVATDVRGTELGGVLKNLIALAIGIVDGVGYGENTKAAIITRGIAEMTEFAVALGADPVTLTGLAGLGDLIATCQSPLSRNNTAGRLIGQGYTQEQTRSQLKQTVEGITSLAPVLAIAREHGITMPIASQVQMVLDGRMAPKNLAPHLATEEKVPQPEINFAGLRPGALTALFDILRRRS